MGTENPTPANDDDRTPQRGPERRCLVTGDSGPRTGLIRFVLSPDNVATPDLAEKLPGRGCYVTADPALIAQAIAKKQFARGFKQPCTVPDGLVEMIARLLHSRLESQLSLAKKAGQVFLGEDAVTQSLRSRKAGLLMLAADASPRTGADLQQTADKAGIHAVHLPLTASQIGLALGRDNTVYLAVKAGKMATTLMRDCARVLPFVTKTSSESRN